MGKDFTGYGEIRIKRVPEELRKMLKAEAKRLGVNVRSLMLFRLWGLSSGPDKGAGKGITDGEEVQPNEHTGSSLRADSGGREEAKRVSAADDRSDSV